MIKKILLILLTSLLLISCTSEINNTQKKLKESASNLNLELAEVKYASRYLSVKISELYNSDQKNKYLAQVNEENYTFNGHGMYYQKNFYSGSSCILTGKEKIDEYLMEKVLISESVEIFFKQYYEKYIQIKQLSFVDNNGFARVYPGVNLVTQVEKNYDFSNFDFYQRATNENNNTDDVIWLSEPYIDPLGRGRVISNASPIYNKNKLLGVVNTTITIKYIVEKYLDKNVIIVSNDGNIIGIDSSLSGIFNLLPPKKYKYTDIIRKDIYVDDDYNVFNNKDKKIRDLFIRIFDNGQQKFTLRKDTNYTLYVEDIPEVNWKMIKVVR